MCALVVVALVVHAGRRAFIQSFFVDGAAASTSAPASASASSLSPSPRVRVVMLDGLSRHVADATPGLLATCNEGVRLDVDVGFPTVSLPVQHVLWTGLTQQESGVQYRVAGFESPPPNAIPAGVPGAIAVAESHVEIAGSFGFSMTQPASEDEVSVDWRESGFWSAAQAALQSEARLVFVHVLRIDEAGHAEGESADTYTRAAADATAQLAEWMRADPKATWLWLADHGHRPLGGHGGPEDDIRVVRACLTGPGLPASLQGTSGAVQLRDLSRALADLLDLSHHGGGRALDMAMDDPGFGSTVPGPGTERLVLAAFVLLGAVVGLWRLGPGPTGFAVPWWIAVAYALVVLFEGAPTLSNPITYPSLWNLRLSPDEPFSISEGGLRLWRAMAFSLPVLAFSLYRSRQDLPRALAFQLGPALAIAVAAIAVCWGSPPLMPVWTAHASLALALSVVGCLGAAAALVPLALAHNPAKPGGD